MTIIDQLIHTSPELGAAARDDRLCVCDCRTEHPGGTILCDLIADETGGLCPTCGDIEVLTDGASVDIPINGYAATPWSAWQLLTDRGDIGHPIDGRLIVNVPWRGHRDHYARPAAVRTGGYITHVGIVASVHPACTCPDWWDHTTVCRPWGQPAPTRSVLAHWELVDVIELPDPVRHKITGWMTRRTHRAVMAQL